ncbi:hypothetical protein SSX86_002145 [Deinandra increscens subsp. villosa]|uniref:Uncharacterized protein n=1 Tax=Deinandra increscens subsp. villosa TaxID=3103831 RepID=A0AAP0H7R5_9ASTR
MSSNRNAMEPPTTHSHLEDYSDHTPMFHKRSLQPSSIPYVPQKSQSSTSSHAESSQSRPSLDNHASPERSFFEPTLDHENVLDDEYEMKLLNEVEIQDEQGNILRTQKMRAKDVYKLKEGEKVLVHLNENDQPVKAAAGLCTRFMTLLLKQPNLCPIEAKNWEEVKTGCGVGLIRELRAKFSIPQGENVDKVLLKHFNERYRSLKHRKKTRLFRAVAKTLNEANNIGVNNAQEIQYTEEEILHALDLAEPPPNVFHYQWELYKSHLRSDESQKLSQSGKKARAEHLHSRTTGAKSFARLRDEFKLKHKRDANPLEFFESAYQTKEGTYLKDASRDFMDSANEEVSKKISDLGGGSESIDIEKRSVIEREVMNELMGPDRPGRARFWGAWSNKISSNKF